VQLFVKGEFSGERLCVEIQVMATLAAKLELGRVGEAALGAYLFQLSSTFAAKGHAFRVLKAAFRALHSEPLLRALCPKEAPTLREAVVTSQQEGQALSGMRSAKPERSFDVQPPMWRLKRGKKNPRDIQCQTVLEVKKKSSLEGFGDVAVMAATGILKEGKGNKAFRTTSEHEQDDQGCDPDESDQEGQQIRCGSVRMAHGNDRSLCLGLAL
jgi:hypothetical protein